LIYQIVAAALAILLVGCGKGAGDATKSPEVAASPQNQDSDDDGPGVSVKKNAQVLAAIKVEELRQLTLQPQLIAYGRLEEDPSESFVVRSPMTGNLRAASNSAWPELGQTVASGTALGFIDPRLSPTDRIGLENQLANANAELNSSAASIQAARAAYERARALNADNKNISDRAVQEAVAKLAVEQAREAGIRSTIQILSHSLEPAAMTGAPVNAVRGGDVVELLAHPGEAVEQGAPLLRLAHLDHLLARVDFPVGQRLGADAGPARIFAAGWEDQPGVPAERVAAVASSDPHAQGVTVLYRLTGTLPGLRPGAAVSAHFSLQFNPGRAAAKGVLIPRSAIVEQDGRLWAYVQTKDDRFSRRPVPLDTPTSAGFLTGKGFSPGDRVVIVGAQTLLSEEFKSRNEADTN
jgi:membrane fusion protein, multidrug efflux system